jgi:tetratricopeptide (TPR) repeat protein
VVTEPDPERDFLVRSLEDLERERAAGDLADDDYADLKARYERKLAERSGGEDVAPDGRSLHQKRRWGRVLATVAVLVVVGVGAGLGVAAWSGSRDPGQQVSGRDITTGEEQMAAAGRLFQQGDAAGAIKIYPDLLAENPKDVEALTYLGWTLRNVSLQQQDDRLFDSGVKLIERATQIDPTYSEAWFFRGIIYYRDEEQPEKAVDALKLAIANDPIPAVESAARELLAEIAQQS